MDIRVGRHYKLGRKIGSGSFGDVYLGADLVSGGEVAIKMESVHRKNPHLLFECKVYRALSGGVGIPNIHWYGIEGDYTVMVMDLLGPSLEDLFAYCSRQFRLRTTLMLADQMLQRLEYVHSRHYIHRDIKPHNFLMGRSSRSDRVFVIDFGLAKRYRDPKTLAHIPYRDGKSLTGTARYVSINTHLGVEQSRRDDLESLGYVLLYFVQGVLPWQGLKATSKRDKYEKIMVKKMTSPVEQLCAQLPIEFAKYIDYCRTLRFTDCPNYTFLRKLFQDLYFREAGGLCYDFVFDWVPLSNSASSSSGTHNHHPQTDLDLPRKTMTTTDAAETGPLAREEDRFPARGALGHLVASTSPKVDLSAKKNIGPPAVLSQFGGPAAAETDRIPIC